MTAEEQQRKVRALLELSKEDKQGFLDSIDHILTDCDGVLWELTKNFEGVGEAINNLKAKGKQFKYISNNSFRTDEQYVSKFKELGVEMDISDVIHPAASVVDYLKKIDFNGLIYCIASTNFKNHLKAAGFRYLSGPEGPIEESFTTLLKVAVDKKPVKAVIIDTHINLTSLQLLRAEIYLKDPDCILISGATDLTLSVVKDFHILGPGAFPKILEQVSGKRSITLAKPGDALKDIIFDKLEIADPKRVVFLGDMLQQDVAFGKLCGFQTVLIFSGGSSKQTLEKHTEVNEIPDFYLEKFSDFSKFVEDLE